MTKQLTDENNLKQIRKIEILKKRKRRLEKALIRKYKEQKNMLLQIILLCNQQDML